MRDYSERRQMRSNVPPRRPSTWPYVLLFMVLLLGAFLAGVGTGWYLWRQGGRFYKAPPAAPLPAAQKQGALPPQGEPIAPAASPQAAPPAQGSPSAKPYEKVGDAPPLTFYDTLKKGNKGLIGTGINQPKEGQPAPAQPAAPKTANPPQAVER